MGGTSARGGHVAPAAAGAGAGGAGGSRAASSMVVNGRVPLNSGRATGAAAAAPSRARGGALSRVPSSSGGGGGSSSANNTVPMTKGAPPAAAHAHHGAPLNGRPGAHGALGKALGAAGAPHVRNAAPARRALDFGAGGLASVGMDDDVLAFTPVDVHTHDDEGDGELDGADELADPYDEHDGRFDGGYGEGEDEDEEPYDEYDEYDDGRYDGGRYEDEDEDEDEDEVPERMSSGWAPEVDGEIDGDEELDDGYGYDDEEEDDEERLSPQDVEQLVERYVSTRKRCDELEGENLKLTKQLLDIAHKQAPDTLVIQVSPEMW